MFDVVQVMLLSDGSVTRHLQLLTDLPVQVVTPSDLLLILTPMHLSNVHLWLQHCSTSAPADSCKTLISCLASIQSSVNLYNI